MRKTCPTEGGGWRGDCCTKKKQTLNSTPLKFHRYFIYLPIDEISAVINKLGDVKTSGFAPLFLFAHLKSLIATADYTQSATMIYYLIN
jgi:hypothetical protein